MDGKRSRAVALWAVVAALGWGALYLLFSGTAYRLASTVAWVAGECVR